MCQSAETISPLLLEPLPKWEKRAEDRQFTGMKRQVKLGSVLVGIEGACAAWSCVTCVCQCAGPGRCCDGAADR